jgi:hypothetical protein
MIKRGIFRRRHRDCNGAIIWQWRETHLVASETSENGAEGERQMKTEASSEKYQRNISESVSAAINGRKSGGNEKLKASWANGRSGGWASGGVKNRQVAAGVAVAENG